MIHSALANSKLKQNSVFCAQCHCPLEAFHNRKNKNGDTVYVPVKKPFGFALFVKENYKGIKKPGVTHVNVMLILAEQFSKLTVTQKKKYRKSLAHFNATV